LGKAILATDLGKGELHRSSGNFIRQLFAVSQCVENPQSFPRLGDRHNASDELLRNGMLVAPVGAMLLSIDLFADAELQSLIAARSCGVRMNSVNTNDPANAPTGKWEGEDSDPGPDERLSAPTKRDLLFGRLAVVSGVIDQNTLGKAQQQLTDSAKSLGKVLVESGAINEDERQTIEILLG